MSLVKFITHSMPKSSLFLLFMPIFHRIFFTGNAAIRRRMVFLLKIPISFSSICHRVCLKNHSRNLHAPLCGIFHPNSVAVARYGALIRAKYPTNCDAHLAESLFQTRSRTAIVNWKKQCTINIRTIKIVSQLHVWDKIHSRDPWKLLKIYKMLINLQEVHKKRC